jgi:hypothetical protein
MQRSSLIPPQIKPHEGRRINSKLMLDYRRLKSRAIKWPRSENRDLPTPSSLGVATHSRQSAV